MGFSMEVVDAIDLKEQVTAQVQAEPAEKVKLRHQAENNAQAVMNVNMDSLGERRQILQSIESFGIDSMKKSASKNSLLKTTVGDLSKSGAEGGLISKNLTDLHQEIKTLDPSGIDFTRTGVLGKLFNPVRAYFEKYEKSESVIADIAQSLDRGKSTLKNDNTTLELEEQNLRELTKRIVKEAEMGMMMDECITQKLEEARSQNWDADKIRFVEEEILFPLRQRVMDIQQMVVVNQQGIIAMEVVRRNNQELIRGVDRAKTVTMSALRTAVIVAGALYNQKIVLQKIQMLNQATNNIISGTSKMLKDQGAEIQRQSMETGVSVETLKIAFEDVMGALDSISQYKQDALPIMRDNIQQFMELAVQGEERISRLERGSALEF
ncbi:MAG: toxic anion resistance protein [Clostridiales bacterium]|jgi:uncharacterized protein YaaN involved in tellurite resistance|nr:toxic anion resistance protein [Clostridiales bacterium]